MDAYTLLCNPPVEFLPFLHRVLIFNNPSILPELLTVVGREGLKNFLMRFEGQTITIPTWESLESSILDAYLLYRFETETNIPALCAEMRKLFPRFSYDALWARAQALRKTLNDE